MNPTLVAVYPNLSIFYSPANAIQLTILTYVAIAEKHVSQNGNSRVFRSAHLNSISRSTAYLNAVLLLSVPSFDVLYVTDYPLRLLLTYS